MTSIILETVSSKKLIVASMIILIFQIAFFLIGGLVAPTPDNVQPLLANVCIVKKNDASLWFARQENCDLNTTHGWFQKAMDLGVNDSNQIVFSWKFPLPREGFNLSMSPWHQNMIAVFKIDFDKTWEDSNTFDNLISGPPPEHVIMDVKLGYKDQGDLDWQEIAESINVKRPLKCDTEDQEHYFCDLIPLFELGSVNHNEYLINLRFSAENKFQNKFDLWIYVIHQNGGFTFVWFCLKTFVFPIVAFTLIWFIWRLKQLQQKPNVLEQTLLALGCAITLLNFPIDWLTLWLYMPFMLLYSDIRQGLFYSVLLCFWVIFSGEHMMDQIKRGSVQHYWKQLLAVGIGCICMFLFDMCERGYQLTNPFFSIWSTTNGANLAFSMIVLAGIAACVYFIYLVVIIAKVFRNICAKKAILESMSKPRQKFYKNMIYRFSFLMVLTLICAGMTVSMFIVGQVSEGYWKWGEHRIEYTSAVQTGVYGMWNMYVFSLLILYAPSKNYKRILLNDDSTVDDRVEFTNLPMEPSIMSSFVQKSTIE